MTTNKEIFIEVQRIGRDINQRLDKLNDKVAKNTKWRHRHMGAYLGLGVIGGVIAWAADLMGAVKGWLTG